MQARAEIQRNREGSTSTGPRRITEIVAKAHLHQHCRMVIRAVTKSSIEKQFINVSHCRMRGGRLLRQLAPVHAYVCVFFSFHRFFARNCPRASVA